MNKNQKNTQYFDVLIIGGGFSGVITAINLLKKSQTASTFGLINDKFPLSRGIAYSTNEPYHLLNVPAGKMSAFPDEPNNFVDWLATHPDFSSTEELHTLFIPRIVYGEYIQHLLNSQIQSSPSTLHQIKDEAIALKVESNGYKVSLKNPQQKVQSPKIVLALGNALPFNVLQKYNITNQTKRYITNPWDFERIKQIPSDKDIVIIGSGLTTVDLLLTLKQNMHEGKIHVFSRHGFFPKAHKPFEPISIPHNIDSFSTALKSLRYLKLQLKSHTNWRAVIDSLRPITQTIWQNWPNKEKKRFIKHLRVYWDIHRHRIAPEIMQSLKTIITANQVTISAGSITYAERKSNLFEIHFATKHAEQLKRLQSDYIINATGPNYISYMNHPLIESLFNQNLTCWDNFKLGINVNFDNLLVNDHDKVSQNLYALGPLTKSKFWEVIAVPDIRDQANNIAQKVLAI